MNTLLFAQQHSKQNAPDPAHWQPAAHLPLRCANCDIEIAWTPTRSGGLTYCCSGCAQGGPCSCDYSEHANVVPGTSAQMTPSANTHPSEEGSKQRG